jgi:hypothetical protein
MISIILKPAYDRLIEGPYWEGKKARFAATIGVLALASFYTLWILGDFRFESHGFQQQVARNAGNTAELLKIEAAMASSGLGQLAFILSGLLFAAAGAVSLSIGMRYARQHRHGRKPAAKRLKEASDALANARAERKSAEQDLFSRTSELERLTVLVRDEPEAAELERRADEVAAERRSLLERFVDIRTLRLRSLYDDGYQLGAAQSSEAATASEERPRRKRPRPFVALRRAIRELSLAPNNLN